MNGPNARKPTPTQGRARCAFPSRIPHEGSHYRVASRREANFYKSNAAIRRLKRDLADFAANARQRVAEGGRELAGGIGKRGSSERKEEER